MDDDLGPERTRITRLMGASRRFQLGVALLVVPFLLVVLSLAWLAFPWARPSPRLVIPLLMATFVLELLLGSVGVFLILSSPESQPWRQ